MFTLPDYLAAGVGLAVALYVVFFGRRDHDGNAFLLAFGSAATATYLVIMAYALGCDQVMLTSMMRSNPVTVFGALLYAAVINLKSLRPMLKRAVQ